MNNQPITITITWDDYTQSADQSSGRWAISDRGWAVMTEGHPDGGTPGGNHTCGWYLHYDAHGDYPDRGILASAYLLKPYGGHLAELGSTWHQTIASAKAWIESRLAAYLWEA